MGGSEGGPGDALPSTATWQQVREAALRRLRSFTSPVVRNEAEDLAQEVAIRFAEASRTQVIRNPAAWATTAASRLALNLLEKRDREVFGREGDGDLSTVEEFILSGFPTSAGGTIREQADRLVTVLEGRELELVLLVAQGVPHAEIAEQLGYANANTVKATVNRVRRQVDARAADAGIDPDWADHPHVYQAEHRRGMGAGPDR